MQQSMKAHLIPIIGIIICLSCTSKNANTSRDIISGLNLKKGTVISCGSPDKEFGQVQFRVTGNIAAIKDFPLALELLHSFEYDEAEKVFGRIIEEDPDCAMAYWGVAMCNFHPLWEPPSPQNLVKGSAAAEIAKSIPNVSLLESGFIKAV
ncbi:MAG TPA: hypothetical protein VGC95_02910, partial [Chitinophagaceae bacterium]